jgi:hypothetical protein
VFSDVSLATQEWYAAVFLMAVVPVGFGIVFLIRRIGKKRKKNRYDFFSFNAR